MPGRLTSPGALMRQDNSVFRSYIFLSKCPSSRILMEHIRHEAKMSMTKDICDVIEVLDDFIAEKGGFTKIRSLKQ